MKKTISVAAGLAVMALPAHAALVSYYNLNESSGNVLDQTATTGPGTPAGTLAYSQASVPAGTYGAITVSAAVSSSFGSAVDFASPGIGNFRITNDAPINALTNGAAGTGSMTFSAWLKPEGIAPSVYQTLASTGQASTGWKLTLRPEGTLQFVGTGVVAAGQSTVNLANDQWYHVAMTYNNSNVEYFVNGASAGTTTIGLFNDEGAGAETKIGGRAGGVENFLGLMDEVKYDDAILTVGEIQASATAVPEPSSSALLGLAGLALILRRRK